MPRLGAHLSIAGGLFRAVDRAEASGCAALQIFTKSAGQWRARPLPRDEIAQFRRRVRQTGIRPVLAHNSYLINIAAADAELRRRSLDALAEELDRAETLGLDGLVMHPGSYTSGSEADGLRLIAEGLGALIASRRYAGTRILLEHTAGQGTNLGHRFEHLAAIIDGAGASRRIGVCLDTCHLLAAGYDIRTPDGYRDTFDAFERIVGLSRLKAFHLNDSKKPCGSRVDRHEHIGKGCLGLAPFRRILNDPRFSGLPMLLETPKLDTSDRRRGIGIDPLDAMNLGALRGLIEPERRPAGRRAFARRPARDTIGR
ncbi:MAG TPA: deoxyribonuclease IV [Vicinamibacterales bacterium]|nr:deoxyribonuclease IV [Vicinamibacterales bacterium]